MIYVGENPGPGTREELATMPIVGDLQAFRTTEGSTENPPLVFGVETTVLWTTAARKGAQCYKGVLEGT